MIGVLLFGFVLLTGAIGPARIDHAIDGRTAGTGGSRDERKNCGGADVARSWGAIPGPALFENLALLGFDAGRGFQYDRST